MNNFNWQELEKLIYQQERIYSIIEVLHMSVIEVGATQKQINDTLMEIIISGDEIKKGFKECLEAYLKDNKKC